MPALDELQNAGLIRRRLRGGYAPTRQGLRYLRDVILRNEELRAEMGTEIDLWESGRLTKDGKREALVELIRRGWEKDGVDGAESLARLWVEGFDPLSTLKDPVMEARYRETEEFLNALRAGDKEGVPILLFDAYQDAIARHGLEEWRQGDDEPTLEETNAETRARGWQLTEAQAAYTLWGGDDRWEAFSQAVIAYGEAAIPAVLNARYALYASDVGFSESTDPAFEGRVKLDDQ